MQQTGTFVGEMVRDIKHGENGHLQLKTQIQEITYNGPFKNNVYEGYGKLKTQGFRNQIELNLMEYQFINILK